MAGTNTIISIETNTTSAVNSFQALNNSINKFGNSAKKISSQFSKLENSTNAVSIATTKLEISTQNAESKLSLLGTRAENIISIYDFTSKIISGFVKTSGELISAYSQQEQAETRVAATLQATGNAIGMTIDELKDLASSFQAVTTYGDETVLEVEKLFISTQKISKQVLPEAVSTTLDIAAAMGEDATNAAKKLAKVLADPKANLEALKDSNIQLTESQKEQIQELQEANNLYGAQSVVLEAVKSSYGGVAEALANTDSGKLTQIKNVWGDIKEGLGGKLLDTISPALDTLYEKLSEINNLVNDIQNEKSYKKEDLYSNDAETLMGAVNQLEWDQKTGYTQKGRDAIIAYLLKRYEKDPNKQQVILNNFADGQTVKKYVESNEFYKEYVDDRTQAEEEVSKAKAKSAEEQAKDYAMKNKSLSVLAQIEDKEKAIAEAKELQSKIQEGSDTHKQIGEIIEGYERQRDALIAQRDGIEEIKELTASELIDKYSSLSITAQIAEKEKEIAEVKAKLLKADEGNDEYKKLDEIVTGLEKEKEALIEQRDGIEEIKELTASELIDKYSSLSITAQIAEKEKEITKVTEKRSKVNTESDEYKILEEIVIGLEKEKKALEESAQSVEENKNALSKWMEKASPVIDEIELIANESTKLIGSCVSLYSTIINNQISEVDRLLNESERKWDKYLTDLEDKQELQKDSLAHLYDEGLISLEEYNQANQQMYEDKRSAMEEAEKEEEELQEKKNELAKKQFDAEKANNITQAVINGAMAITDIWKSHAGNPILAGVLTGLAVAQTTAQVATISSQQYTPMATGGIVTKPTYALLGEGGSKEMVLPLNKQNLNKVGVGNNHEGVINININIGTSFSSDQLSKDIFNGIERAQRTGLLPNWRYA